MIDWLRSLDWGLIIPIALLVIAAVCMVVGWLLSRRSMRASE